MTANSLNVLEILKELGYQGISDSGAYYRTKPIYRDSDNYTSLSINKKTGCFTDFGGDITGDLSVLVKTTLQCDEKTAIDWLNTRWDIKLNELPKYERDDSPPKKIDSSILSSIEKNHEYWVERGIEEEVIKQFDGGICHSGRMRGRYVFPIFDERDNLIGLSGRDIWGKKYEHRPKWKHCNPSKYFIYPLLSDSFIKKSKRVILVESIGDCLALYNAGVNFVLVCFGKYISFEVINYLLKVNPIQIIIALNNDEAGIAASHKNRKRLIRYFDREQVVIHLPITDFGEMTPKEILNWRNDLPPVNHVYERILT